jgi:hypothetical protein
MARHLTTRLRLYTVDVTVCATAYIKAANKTSALAIAQGLARRTINSDPRDGSGDIEISTLPFDDPMLPDVSVSPAMTCHGVWAGARVERTDD